MQTSAETRQNFDTTSAKAKQDTAPYIAPDNEPGISGIPGYLSKEATAAYLAKSEATLDRWHRLRVGPPRTKLGNSTYYREAALKAWIVAQEQASKGDGGGAAASGGGNAGAASLGIGSLKGGNSL